MRLSVFVCTILWCGAVATMAQGNRGAATDSADGLSFLVVGDWGGQDPAPYTTQGELDVAKQMGLVAAINHTQFVLGVGDNFYYNGVDSPTSARFKQTFEDVFSAPSLQVPWYHIAGNHDHGGNVTAQTLYVSPNTNRWNFPSKYYTVTKSFMSGSRNVSAFFVFTDSFDMDDAGPDPTQVAWIQQTLAATAQYDWVFVVGHYPIYSVAAHGSNWILQRDVLPWLDKYQVAAYFSGHDHNIQHIRLANYSCDFFVSGAGHTLEYWTDHWATVPNGALKFFLPPSPDTPADGAFLAVRLVNESVMQVDAIDSFGTTVYSTTHTNPRSAARVTRA